MFANDTNLFYSNSKINELFENVNMGLVSVADWGFANKLSIIQAKQNISFFINKWIAIIYP